jgi:hypothetical protein
VYRSIEVVGRTLINVALLVTLAAIGVTNLPDSHIKAKALTWANPYLFATGLDQDWTMFAPNPRDVVIYVQARTDYADGTWSVWRPPVRPGAAELADYRWQKFGEQLHYNHHSWMWPQLADFLAARARADGRRPVRVTLTRRWYKVLPPGDRRGRGPWHDATMYTVDLAGAR